jgi:hypothetical protein
MVFDGLFESILILISSWRSNEENLGRELNFSNIAILVHHVVARHNGRAGEATRAGAASESGRICETIRRGLRLQKKKKIPTLYLLKTDESYTTQSIFAHGSFVNCSSDVKTACSSKAGSDEIDMRQKLQQEFNFSLVANTRDVINCEAQK